MPSRTCLAISSYLRRAPAVFLAAAGLVMTLSCSGTEPGVSYEEGLLSARAAKDEAFRTSADSPIPPERRGELLPLAYFPPDAGYRVPAVLKPEKLTGPPVMLPTSTGKMRQMVRLGVLAFTLKGQSLTLAAFVEADAPNLDHLFVPFPDRTTGTETYAAGRYLEIGRTATGIYVIDFNRAFNPFCAYNEEYDCPYPPPENRLPVPVRAGERVRRGTKE